MWGFLWRVGLLPDRGSAGAEPTNARCYFSSIATLVSVSLQYGVPVDSLVRKFEPINFP